MKAGASCSSSSNTRNSIIPQGTVVCGHKLEAVVSTASKGSNVGKRFYGCSLSPKQSCGFFRLLEKKQMKSGSIDIDNQSEDLEKKVLANKVSKMKRKNMKLIKDLKLVIIALILSWIIFAFSWMFKTCVCV